MTRTIAILNRKGGVGKTTTALCMADSLSRRGYRVLSVDLDQQHNLTAQFGAQGDGVASAYDLLTSKGTRAEEAIQSCERGDIVPSDEWMIHAEEKMTTLDNREYMLADALEGISGRYDFIVLDCPMTLGLVVKNALVAADEIVVPVLCDEYSEEGMIALVKQVNAVRSNRRLNPGLRIAGVLVTQFDPRPKVAKRALESLRAVAEESGTRLFDSAVRRCCKTPESQRERVPLIEYAPECTTALDYERFVDEFLKGGE